MNSVYVLAADQRDVLAEFPPVDVQQAAAMSPLLGRHLGKDIRAAGIFGAQALGDVQIDTAVLFLIGDGKGEDLPLC